MSESVAYFLSFGLLGAGFLAAVERLAPLFPSYVLLIFLGLTAPDSKTLLFTIGVTTLGSLIGGLGWFVIGWSLGPPTGAQSSGGLWQICAFETVSL